MATDNNNNTADSIKKLEDTAGQAIESLKATYEQGRVAAEDKIREFPFAAVAGAAAFGFIFRFGVIRGLLGMVFRLAAFSVKPLLITAAIMKVADLMKESAPAAARPTPPSGTRKKAVKASAPLELIDAPEIENPVLR